MDIFLEVITANKQIPALGYIITYFINKFPGLLKYREQTARRRYPIIMLLSNLKTTSKSIREALGKFMMDKSDLELRKAYFNFILNRKYAYQNFRHIIVAGLEFEDLLSIAREREFPIFFTPMNEKCLYLLHKEIVNKATDKQFIIYAIEQSLYCKTKPLLKDLDSNWNPARLDEIAYLKEHGHELLIAAANGCHKKYHGIKSLSTLEISIKQYFSSIFNENELAEIEERCKNIDRVSNNAASKEFVADNSSSHPYVENNPSLIFYNANSSNHDPLAELFVASVFRKES